jgi:trigger factor
MNGKDLVYTATIEVMPEIQPKNYTGLSLTRDKTDVTDKDVEQEVARFLDHHATLEVASSADKKLEKGDFADFSFKGGIVTETGVEEREGMSGQRVIELGTNGLIAGFEDEMIGLKRGDKKTFRITFPKDYDEKSIAGKEAEFSVDIHEVKVKKLPELTDDFVKENGYESIADLRQKAKEGLVRGRKEASDQKLRSDLLQQVIDKNKFDVPEALVTAQLQASLQEIQQDLRQRGFNDQMAQEAIGSEFENIKKRAETQVRAGLLLDAIAKAEKIEVKDEDYENHFKELAENTKMGYDKIKEFYTKNPSRKESFRFRLLEDLTIKHIISKSKVKEA